MSFGIAIGVVRNLNLSTLMFTIIVRIFWVV